MNPDKIIKAMLLIQKAMDKPAYMANLILNEAWNELNDIVKTDKKGE